NRLKKVDYFACLVRRAGEVLSTRTKVLSCSTLPHLALSLDCNYAVVLDGEREPSMLESERLLAKQLTAPARQRRYVGFVISRDAVEIVHGGDDLGCHAMPLGRHAQEHLEQFDGCMAVRCSLGALDLRQGLQVTRQSALDRLDNRLAPFRALETLGQRAQVSEPLNGRRRLHRNVADD